MTCITEERRRSWHLPGETVGNDLARMEVQMAQFFFHCTSSEKVLVDRSGDDLLDLTEVRHRASSIMRRCIETGTVDGDCRDWLMHVVDEEDEEVFVLSFSDVIGRLH